MDRPVRGSFTDGATGASSPKLNPLNAFSLSPVVLALFMSSSRCWNLLPNTIGLSEMLSAPTAMALSISPTAILAPRFSAACRLEPQAICMVVPGVRGDSPASSSASRAMLKSREWLITAPPITSSIFSPLSPYLSASPPMAAAISDRLVSSE